MSTEIFVVPAFGQGHLLPSIELCKHLASRNYKITLIIFANLSSFIPSSLRDHSLVQIVEIQPPPPPQPGSNMFNRMLQDRNQLVQGLETILSTRTCDSDSKPPVCAILDVLLMMDWASSTFKKFQVPTIGFFTQGACATAMEYATWKANPENMKPGEVRPIPGLPQEMALTDSDLERRPGRLHGGGGGPGGSVGKRKVGPPNPGELPPWVEHTEDSLALMINTCDDLERPFINYLVHELAKPVWGVGPLLPNKYWDSVGSILRDGDVRSNQRSNISEDEVIQWLDSKPRQSVLYVSFGSALGPTMEEYPHLASALEEWTGSFIWVIQHGSGKPGPPGAHVGTDEGFFPHGLGTKVGERGLIIHGWAPQLLILSHRSTGGFLSHCGWNSTVEAIGRGVPFLAWPIRGDQYYDAKLVVSHLKVGHMVCDDMSKMVTKSDIVKGIERLMGDEELKKRAAALRSKFEHGFPATSLAALDHFKDFIHKIAAKN